MQKKTLNRISVVSRYRKHKRGAGQRVVHREVDVATARAAGAAVDRRRAFERRGVTFETDEQAQRGDPDMAFVSSEANSQGSAFIPQNAVPPRKQPSSPHQSLPTTSDKVRGVCSFICFCFLI